MTAFALAAQFPSFVGRDGSALEGGYVYFGETGKDPRQYPASVFYDEALTIPATMPLRTRSGFIWRNGAPSMVYAASDCSLLVLDAAQRQTLYAASGVLRLSSVEAFTPSGTGAVARSVQSKLRDVVGVKDFGAVGDGVTDDTQAFKYAAASGKQVRVPGGTYKIVIASASDTAVFASGTCFIADGVVILDVHGPSVAPYYPTWAIVSKVGTQIVGKFKFVQNGNFTNTGSGTADPYGTGHAYNWYVYSSHVFIHNLQHGRIENLEFAGATTANVTNLGMYHAACADVDINNLYGRDLASVILTGSGEDVRMRNIAGDYLNADAAVPAYGPGHIIYSFIQSGVIENIWDGGHDTGAGNTGHSLSVKSATGGLTIKNIQSLNPAGPLTYQDCIDMVVDGIAWKDNGATYTDANSPFYGSAGSGTSTRNDFRNVRLYSARDRIMFGGFGTNYSRFDLTVIREAATSTNPISDLRNALNYMRLRFIDKGSAQSVIFKPSDSSFVDNLIDLDYVGPFAPLNDFSAGGVRNRINVNPKISSTGRRIVMQPSATALGTTSATLLLTTAMTQQPVQLIQEANLSAGASIAANFNLPGHGVWLASLTVMSADRNHARTGLYQVICDDASSNDFTTVALIGSEATKGNDRYASLTVTVTKDGLLAVSTTDSQAPSELHSILGGFTQLASFI